MSRSYQLYSWGIFLLGLILSLYYGFTLKIGYDQQQMLDRASSLLVDGTWIHYGNRVTGGGYIPGSLMTLLSAAPMMLWKSLWAPLIIVNLCHVACFWPLRSIARRLFSERQTLWFMALFWLTPWRASEAILWNPGYLFLPATLHMWSAFHMKQGKSFFYTLIHVLSVGIALQLHNSSIVLGLMSLSLWAGGRIRVSWPAIFSGIAITAASLVPFFITLANEPELAPVAQESSSFFFKGLVHVYPILKGMLYWPRYASLYFPRYIFSYMDFSWVGGIAPAIKMLWPFVSWGIAIPSFALAIYGFIRTLRWVRVDRQDWILGYSRALLFGMLASCAISPVNFTHWHLLIVFPAILLVQFYNLRDLRIPRKLGVLTVIIMVAYNIVAATGSHKHSIQSNWRASEIISTN